MIDQQHSLVAGDLGDLLKMIKQQYSLAGEDAVETINWQHPLVGGNALGMGMMNAMAAQQALVEGYQRKWFNFMMTGKW